MNGKRYVLETGNGFYCTDDKLRGSFHFGTVKGCLKFWHKKAYAVKKGREISSEFQVHTLFKGDTITGRGEIIRKNPLTNPSKPDMLIAWKSKSSFR